MSTGSALTDGELPARAAAIARSAHDGQRDKAGVAYIAHPARVAAAVSDDPYAEAVAWLHDVLEDTAITRDALADAGMPELVIDAVEALTRRAEDSSERYYERVRANPLALRVKAADIADNADPERLAKLDQQTAERLRAKYRSALAALFPGGGTPAR